MSKQKILRFIAYLTIFFFAISLAVFLYFRFYGKNILENALSSALGMQIKFKAFSIDLRDYKADFKGLTIPGKIEFGDKTMLNAEKFTIKLDKEHFNETKEVVFDEIYIEGATLAIKRNKNGVFNVSRYEKEVNYRQGVAYADDIAPPVTPAYNFAEKVRKFTIKDSTIEFEDSYLYDVPYKTVLNNVNLDVKTGKNQGYIPLSFKLSFYVPTDKYDRNGRVELDGSAEVYKYLIDATATVDTTNIDLMQFQPYFEQHTPFMFEEGLFSSKTKVSIQNNLINSPTTMVFHRLALRVKPGQQNAQFLHTSVSKLLPYLTSSSGEVIVDFVIKGPLDNPTAGMGPKLQQAVGMAVTEEILRVLQELQK